MERTRSVCFDIRVTTLLSHTSDCCANMPVSGAQDVRYAADLPPGLPILEQNDLVNIQSLSSQLVVFQKRR